VARLTNKNVLVTGATGFIGRHLVDRLLAEEASVWTLSLEAAEVARPSVHEIVCPLDQVQAATWRDGQAPRFDVVYHLAAYIPKASAAANDLERVFHDNIAGTRQLLASLLPVPGRVVFASTVDVYAPGRHDDVLSESSSVAPTTLYGSSKLFGEAYVRHWARQTGVASAILRLGHIYGPGEGAYRKLIPETIRRLLAGERPILYGDAAATRDLLHVDDVVEAMLRATLVAHDHLGPVNIVRGESVTVGEIVALLAKSVDATAAIDHRPDAAPPRHLRFDNARMLALLGDWPKVPLSVGLAQEVQSMRSAHRK
jgi:nucleoside-diphosphate-sugar epimerase